MKTSPTADSPDISLISSAALWAAALLIVAAIAGLWFLLAKGSLGVFFLLAAPLALVEVGILRQYSRGRAARRFRAALDTYAEWEIGRQRRRTTRQRGWPLSKAPGVSGSLPPSD
jgi:hypothetical protein